MKTLFLRTASMMSARQLVLLKLSLMAGALSLSPLTDLAPVRDWMCVADAVDAETGAGYADYRSGGTGAADVAGAQGIGVAQARGGASRGTARNGGVIYLSGAEAAGVAGVLVRADGQGNGVQGAEAHFEVGGDGSLLLASEDGGKAFSGYTGDGSGGQGARNGAAAGPGGASGSSNGSGNGSNGGATGGTASRGTTAGSGATGSVGTVGGGGGNGIVNNNSGTPGSGTPSNGSPPATPPATPPTPANPGAGPGNASAGTPAGPGGSGLPAAGSGLGTPGAGNGNGNGNGNSPGTPVSTPGDVAGTPGAPATGGATKPPASGNGGNGNNPGNGGTPPATSPSGGNQVAAAPPPPGAFDDAPVAPVRPAGSAASTDVPEPASIALMMIGLASVLIARRRKA